MPAIVPDRAVVATGDSLQLLQLLPDESVDLVLTSPPYNIGKSYERVLPIDDYLRWCESWLAELHRICAPAGSVWINVGYLSVPGRGTAVPIPYLLWGLTELHLVQEVVWFFRAGVGCRRRFSPRNEKLLWFVKDARGYDFDLDSVRDPDVRYPQQRRHGRLRCNPAGKNPTDVWEIARVTAGRRKAAERVPHPAQMPLALARRVILSCSRPDQVVLDPFFGSGTTAVAALTEGRLAVGLERRSDYVALAEHRIRASL